MAAPYILARTLREAHTFARETLGLPVSQYRVVNSSGTLKSVRGVDLYLVPGWQNRYDRFAMKSAIRWTRMNVIDVANQPVEAPADPRGPLTDDILDLAYAEDAVRSGQGAPGIVIGTFGGAPVVEHPDGLKPAGVQPTLSFDDLFEDVGGSTTPAPEQAEEPAPEPQPETPAEPVAEEPVVKRRRRRCKECGVLVEPDEVESHQKDHENDLVGVE